MPDRGSFWFNRFVQYWTVPLCFDLVDLVNLMGMYAMTAAVLIAFDAQLPDGVSPGLP